MSPARADYRCDLCSRVHERVFDGTPPGHVLLRCCDYELAGDGDYAWTNDTPATRVWTAPSIGRVAGAGGSPARGAK